MNLKDVLSGSEMEKYFNNLPKSIQKKLRDDRDGITSSNDLYVKAENLLNNSKK